MTITYTAQVATSKFGCFLVLLTRWRGSIYKLLWIDFAIFAGVYFTLQCLYRFVLDEEQRRVFESISRYCADNNSRIPLAFVLGFYVSLVMSRWWGALTMIPWPDHMAMFVTASVRGLDERGRLMRRTMVRYLCLAYTITMASISPPVRKRFPTLQHFVEAGLMTENEMIILERLRTPHNKFFIPLAWTTTLVSRARSEGRIKDDFAVKTLNDEINEFRRQLATLFVYDMMTIPLVYTQVVTIAVHMFFLACLMGRQFLTDNPAKLDLYFPVFTFLEYFFYMGWLKVAECLINPFGEDDDDFEINFLIDRNLQVAYLIVDEMHDEHPELIRDQYWDDTLCEMPYTQASAPYKQKQPFKGSASDMRVLGTSIILPTMESIHENDDDDDNDEDDDDHDDIFVSESTGLKGSRSVQRPPLNSKGSGSTPVSRAFSRPASQYQQSPSTYGSPHGRQGRGQGQRQRMVDRGQSRQSKQSEDLQFSMDPDDAVDDVVARLEEGIEMHPVSHHSTSSNSRGPRGSSPRPGGSSPAQKHSKGPAQSGGSQGTSAAAPLLLAEPLHLTQSDFYAAEERGRARTSEAPKPAKRSSLVSPTDDDTGEKKSASSSDVDLSRQSSNISTASSVNTVIEVGGPRQQHAPPSLTLYKLSDGDEEDSGQGGQSSPAGRQGFRGERRVYTPRGRYSRMHRQGSGGPTSPPGTPASPTSPVWVSAGAAPRASSTQSPERTRLPSVPL